VDKLNINVNKPEPVSLSWFFLLTFGGETSFILSFFLFLFFLFLLFFFLLFLSPENNNLFVIEVSSCETSVVKKNGVKTHMG
jgi:hypothetical protein